MNTGKLFNIIGVGAGLLVAPSAMAQAGPPAPAAAPARPAAPVPAPAPVQTGAAPSSPGVAERVLPDHGAPTLEGLELEPGGLTSKEVARRALAVSPSVKEKRAQVSAANQKINETMISFFPKLSVSAGYTRLSNVVTSLGGLVVATNPGALTVGPTGVRDSGGQPVTAVPFVIPTVPNQWSLEAHLNIPLSDYILRVADAAASSKAGSESARTAVAAEKLKVAADAEALYFNWLRSRGQVAIAKNAVERTDARLQDARASFAVGVISKGDLLRIEALVANTELTLNRAESFAALTTGQLAIVMEDWHPDYHVGEGIPEPSQIPQATASLNQTIQEAEERRLEIRAVDQAISSTTHGASAIRAGAMPHLDGFADGFYANPNQRYFPPQAAWHATYDLGLRASWTINETFQNSAAAKEVDANALALMQQRTAVRAGVASEVLSAYLDLARARTAIDKQQAALASAEEGYRVTTDLFRAGRATSTDLIEAESQLLDAKLGDVNDRIDLTLAMIALRHATGQDIPNHPLEDRE